MARSRRASAGRKRARLLPCPPPVSSCVVCGPDNPRGLHVRFSRSADRVTASFTPRRAHQGYHGLMSGGLLSAIFDCLHYRVPVIAGVLAAVTARIEVRYLAPIRIGQRLEFEAELRSRRGRVFETSARALLPDGRVAAESMATYVEVSPDRLPDSSRERLPAGRHGLLGGAALR